MLEHRPHDPVAFLANHLQRSAVGATHIEHAFRILQLGAASSCVGSSSLPMSLITTGSGMPGYASAPTQAETVDRRGGGGGGGGGESATSATTSAGGAGATSGNTVENGLEPHFEKCPSSVEDTILASYQCLQRRGTGHSAFAAAAKQETRRLGAAHTTAQRFRFGRMGGGVCGRDVRLLARRVLLAGAGSLPPPGRSMVKRVLAELCLPADDDVVDYSSFALCLRTVLHILAVADTVRTALVLFSHERTSAGDIKIDSHPQTHKVPTQPSFATGAHCGTASVFARVWNSGQRFLGAAEAVDFVSKLTGLSSGAFLMCVCLSLGLLGLEALLFFLRELIVWGAATCAWISTGLKENIVDIVRPVTAARNLGEIHCAAARAAKEAARRNDVLHTRLLAHRPPALSSDPAQHTNDLQPPPTRQRSGSAGSASETVASNSRKGRRQLLSRTGRGAGGTSSATKRAGTATPSTARSRTNGHQGHQSIWGTSLMEAAPIPPFFVVNPGSASIAEATACENKIGKVIDGVDKVEIAFSDATFISADQLMEAVITLLAKA